MTGYRGDPADLYNLGATIDVDTELKTEKDWARQRADIFPGYLETSLWAGKLVAIPCHGTCQAMIYSPGPAAAGGAGGAEGPLDVERLPDHGQEGGASSGRVGAGSELELRLLGHVGGVERRAAAHEGQSAPDAQHAPGPGGDHLHARPGARGHRAAEFIGRADRQGADGVRAPGLLPHRPAAPEWHRLRRDPHAHQDGAVRLRLGLQRPGPAQRAAGAPPRVRAGGQVAQRAGAAGQAVRPLALPTREQGGRRSTRSSAT